MALINASVKSTLIVSGRDGLGLIDELFEHDVTPMPNICNIIVYCNTEKKMNECIEEFTKKNYKILIDFACKKTDLKVKIK